MVHGAAGAPPALPVSKSSQNRTPVQAPGVPDELEVLELEVDEELLELDELVLLLELLLLELDEEPVLSPPQATSATAIAATRLLRPIRR